MSKNIVTVGGVKGIFVALMTEDGKLNVDAMANRARELAANVDAEIRTDFDTVAAEVNAYLLENPGLKSIGSNSLAFALWERRIESGDLAGKTREEKDAQRTRLVEVLDNYIKASPERFHVGRKTGIAIRYVDGEVAKDNDGNPLYDAEGNTVQAYRWSAEDWTKHTTPKAKKGDESPESK